MKKYYLFNAALVFLSLCLFSWFMFLEDREGSIGIFVVGVIALGVLFILNYLKNLHKK
ncbi:hypothetical protein [Alkalihalobacterium elongatum]|uniref:hypothetical protein n=1 Tax=Alkalihalobacterium elongatum TaxID=2675466 RepID=UPI001C1FFB01|nr:hypothetical protein [Alkalihalobacterium elongatum]